ncbi:MAG: hypothetical protein Q8918_01385 [Bacteroidota bacterium]|nr:hypothetical protein [Bacteroidota bacterium]MDP4211037.1 hypothetical protein [Bacteroidota bacterium]MDP4248741.1 hypothetical protein [Bacteroidota bacterium]
MNLESAIREEHSKAQCSKIVDFIGDEPERFAELMKLFFSGEYRLAQRAAWPMSYCVRNHPSLVKPYFKKLLDRLMMANAHPAVKRNIVRLLQYVEIPKRYQGKLMSICFGFIASPEEAVAVKAFSLTILENLIVQYPAILPEIKIVIESRWEYETPAFRSRAKRILKRK